MSAYLGQRGYSVYKKDLTPAQQKFVREELNVTPYMPKSPVKSPPFPVYQESPEKLYIPKFFGIDNFGATDIIKIPQGVDIDVPFTGEIRDYQKNIIDTYINYVDSQPLCGKGGLLDIPCGRGKCLGIDTPIIMFDGSIKMVQDIIVGDKLMGDDSTPRTVRSLARGKQLMYNVIPDRGDTYTVNKSHILSLKCSKNIKQNLKLGTIIDIPLVDYLDILETCEGLNNQRTNVLLGYRVGIDFPVKEVDLDPYFLGYYLGNSTIYKTDQEISILERYLLYNCNNNCNNKYIPFIYKTNSRFIRLNVLAGLIDACGRRISSSNINIPTNKYEIIFDSETLIDDIIYIIRSLGLAAYKQAFEERKSCDDDGKNALKTLYKTYIHGRNLHEIPVRNVIKKIFSQINTEDVLITPITIRKKYIDNYYGFEIDGNRRFLLGDFTVTHNTVMALNILARLKKKTLIIVHKSFLASQWIERIEQFLPTAKVGQIQGPIIDTQDKDIVIGMLQSLSMKTYPSDMFAEFGLVIVDECHHISSETFVRSLQKIVTLYTLGLSATMQRKDGLTKVFKMFLGEIIYKEKRESNDTVLVKTIKFETDDEEYNEVELDYRGNVKYSTMITKLCKFNPRTEFIITVIENEIKINKDQQILLLAHNKSLLTYIFKAIEHRAITTVGYYVGGMKDRDLKLSESRQVIVATYSMAAEALDIKTLSTLILATPKTDIVQAVGRILRIKHEQPLVIDFLDTHQPFLGQAKKRRAYYRLNKYKIVETDNSQYLSNNYTTTYDPYLEKNKGEKKKGIKEKNDNNEDSDEQDDEDDTIIKKIGAVCLIDIE